MRASENVCRFIVILIIDVGGHTPVSDTIPWAWGPGLYSSSTHALIHCSLLLVMVVTWPALSGSVTVTSCHDGLKFKIGYQKNSSFQLLVSECFVTVSENEAKTLFKSLSYNLPKYCKIMY